MKRLAVIPSDSMDDYLKKGYSPQFLESYYNPQAFFDEVYLLSPLEKDQPLLLGMKVLHTEPKELKQRIKELGIDVVRAYGGNWACAMACNQKVKGVPVVVSVHDQRPDRLYDAVKDADIVLSVSGIVKKLVDRKFRKPEYSWILHNRVDLQIMKPLPQSACRPLDARFPFKHRIVFVGRLSEEKNLDTLIKSLKFLGKEYGLLAIGAGEKGRYQGLAAAEGLGPQCFFIDSVANADLARYYSWCDCMCAPSRHEGFGVVFIEALACGAVVVTSDIEPMNTFITNAENGLLVKDYEDPRSLADAIRQACEDRLLREKIKINARKSVDVFEKSRIDTLEIEYYRRALGLNARRAGMEKGYAKALEWVRQNTLKAQGVNVSSHKKVPYPEVTGYFIPTLLDCGEKGLALQYADFLCAVQNPDGSFCGTDGRKYIFDSGQALRGLLAASLLSGKFKPFAQRAAEYLMSSMRPDGCLPAIYDEQVPPAIQMYVLPALSEAGRLFNEPRYVQAARKAVDFYKKFPDVLDKRHLTHFLAYIIDGFIDMGEADFVRGTVEEIFSKQNKDGGICAHEGVGWVCTVGVAQFGIIACKLGMHNRMERAIDFLISKQNKSGGFWGSLGPGSPYFPFEEISWSNKFFLDLLLLKGVKTTKYASALQHHFTHV